MDPSEQPVQLSLTGCPPRRQDETMQAYFRRRRAHIDAARQRIVQDYYNTRQARLPSPHSDDDDDDEDMADLIRGIEEDIYWDTRPWREFWAYEYPNQRAHRLGIPLVNLDDVEMDLTDMEESEDGRLPVVDSSPIEDEQSSPRPSRKRRRESGEDHDPQPPTTEARGESSGGKKRRRVDTDTDTIPSTAGVAVSGSDRKRKRAADEPQASRAQSESPGVKRRRPNAKTNTTAPTAKVVVSGGKRKRSPDEPHPSQKQGEPSRPTRRRKTNTDTDTRTLPAGVAMSGGKRKRGSDEPQASREQREPTAAKRRKLTELNPITNDTSERSRGSRSRTTRRASDAQDTGRHLSAPAQAGSSRVTRARRQLLSGKDAQLLQLGLRGELEVQGKPRDELNQGPSGDTAGGARRRSGRTRAGTTRPSRTVAL